MERSDVAVPIHREEDPKGFFDVPRRFSDLRLIPRLWKIGTVGVTVIAVLSAGMIDPMFLEGVLIVTSGWSLVRLLNQRRVKAISLDRDLEVLIAESRPFVVEDLRDRIESDEAFASESGHAVLLSMSPMYFSVGALIAGGVIGANPQGVSPWPYIAAAVFGGIPAGLQWTRTGQKWLSLRHHRTLLQWVLERDGLPSVEGGGPTTAS